jgi:hypothetical protein
MSESKMSLLAGRRRMLQGSIHSACLRFVATYFRRDAAKRLSKMTVLGTGFGDRFKVFRGGSRRFKEGARRDGKEGVDGSSPSEGFRFLLA